MSNPYEKFRDRALTPTDLLALERTVLANERTLLAYIRTALGMAAVGGTLIKFFIEPWIWVLGAVLIAAAVVTVSIGVWRYGKIKSRLRVGLGPGAGDLF